MTMNKMVGHRSKLNDFFSEEELAEILSDLFDYYLEYIQEHTYFKLTPIAKRFLNKTRINEMHLRSIVCLLRNFNCRLQELNAVEPYSNGCHKTFKRDREILNELVSMSEVFY